MGINKEKRLLHGTLYVTIYEADQLFGGAVSNIIHEVGDKIEGLVKKDAGKLYATIDVDGATAGCSKPLEHHGSNFKWCEEFHIYCAYMTSTVVFSLKHEHIINEILLGRAYLPVIDILDEEEIDTWLDILDDKHHNPIYEGSKLHVKVQFFDATRDVNWDTGIRTPEFPGVPRTFFPQRDLCRVTLYQDSHVPDNFVPKIPLANGQYYEPQRCWEDIFDAINNAEHLIYIAGWSVYTEITLVRDKNSGGNQTLGELLKRKAKDKKVRVLMLIWHDRTCVDILNEGGIMATHCKETKKYFKGSEVHCVLCPRDLDYRKTFIEGISDPFVFSHHQKVVVVDSAVAGGTSDERRIVSFVGGIDLCDGRYDTQFHSLFRTLDTVDVHHYDFHQPNLKEASIKKGGPREPWHDIHSKLEGPVAWDVLFNFEQRWRKQGKRAHLLRDLKEMSSTFSPLSPITSPEDHETWKVQIFRSIDSGAASGFPTSPEGASKVGLVSRKDSFIDRSIQDAYIHAIRRAKRFIYIENQYFLGSSFDWKANDGINLADIGAIHLIPKELSLKIASKIKKRERFTVYVVIPMWPEGYPESKPVQEILDLQRRTMEMMYTDVVKELRANGIEADPKDYLSFFCLGNREVKSTGEYEPPEKPEFNTDYSRAQANRRFMIYVHAKMMIVDDEYIIVGSANINQRSMDGARDTEIAMGAFQPYHIAQPQKPARGQIHGFRMSLWYEHLGMLDDVFWNPESLECVRKVNELAKGYWSLYCSMTLERDLPGHLLTYPVHINKNGEEVEIVELPGFEHFPDTRGKVLGQKISLPPILVPVSAPIFCR